MHTLPKLFYDLDSLEPYISEKVLWTHYDKHHRSYVESLNLLINEHDDESLSNMSLSQLVMQNGAGGTKKIYNQAAQHWNHSFYWRCLSPSGGGNPPHDLLDILQETFGSFKEFKELFTTAAMENFGSGWTWLVINKDGELTIGNTPNAGNPLTRGLTPLMVIDVWEHAYYSQYKNRRVEYIKAFWNIVDWNMVAKRFRVNQVVKKIKK